MACRMQDGSNRLVSSPELIGRQGHVGFFGSARVKRGAETMHLGAWALCDLSKQPYLQLLWIAASQRKKTGSVVVYVAGRCSPLVTRRILWLG